MEFGIDCGLGVRFCNYRIAILDEALQVYDIDNPRIRFVIGDDPYIRLVTSDLGLSRVKTDLIYFLGKTTFCLKWLRYRRETVKNKHS